MLHKIPQGLDGSLAVLTEPLAAAIQTFENFPIERPATVAILGPGRLGILITFIASLCGHTVLAISRNTQKRERAIYFGASESFSPKEAESAIKTITEGKGVDIAVDATGSPEGLNLALGLVRPRGTVVVKTTCGIPTNGIDMTRVVVDEIRIQGSRCGPFGRALEILKENQEQLRNLIPTPQPLGNAQAAIESAFSEPKVILRVD